MAWRLKILKAVLFPLEVFDHWKGSNKQTGYDFYSDTLLINGIYYSRRMFDYFKEGKIFKINRIENRIITVEEVIDKNKERVESCTNTQLIKNI